MWSSDRADRDVHPLARLVWQLVEGDRAIRSDCHLNMNMLLWVIHGLVTSSWDTADVGNHNRLRVYGGTPKAAPRTDGASGGTVPCRRPLGRPLSDHQRGRDASGLACYPRACPPRTRAGATSRGSERADSCGFLRKSRLFRVSRFLSRLPADPHVFPTNTAVVTHSTRGATAPYAQDGTKPQDSACRVRCGWVEDHNRLIGDSSIGWSSCRQGPAVPVTAGRMSRDRVCGPWCTRSVAIAVVPSKGPRPVLGLRS